MRENRADDRVIMRAIEAQNRGLHREAAALYREAGNQMRDPSEKKELWQASDRERHIYESD